MTWLLLENIAAEDMYERQFIHLLQSYRDLEIRIKIQAKPHKINLTAALAKYSVQQFQEVRPD